MSMTITSGVRELENCESSSIIENAKVLSRGALMGARGNSGVILSQFFRGIYVGLKEIQHNYLTIEEFMNCLLSGRKIAYKAVMAPVEGTILTVVREAAENTESHLNEFDTIDALLEFYYNEAEKTLANTPELLPVLKEAGVVDSGGAGFCKIIEGMLMALKGEILEAKEAKPQEDEASDAAQEIKFAYCTEFILDLRKPDTFEERELTATLSLLGDSLVVIRDTKTVKVHIHTNRPGRVLEIAQKSGEFQTLKIENMHLQHSHLEEGAKGAKAPEAPKANEPKKEFALIAVCFGDGIVNTFKELGVDYVIEGGQTMNPSTEAFVSAIKAVNAKNVIIIPNNGNVVMAAKQAAGMVRGSKVEVILAKTIAQGYASLINYNPEATMEENLEAMGESIAHVKSGEVTYSVRDTEINGVKIVAGDYMGIADGEIIVSVKEEKDAVKGLLEKMIDEESEIATFFCGKDVTEEEKALVEEIVIPERDKNGPFKSICDFAKRVDSTKFNKKSWEAAIKTGAFDRFASRSDLLFNLEAIQAYGAKCQKDVGSGQTDLFAMMGDVGAIPEVEIKPSPTQFSDKEQLLWERDLMGLYLSAHPLDKYDVYFDEQTHPYDLITPENNNKVVTIGGIITNVRTILTKKGDKMAFIKMENKSSETEFIVFPSVFQECGAKLVVDNVVRVTGKINATDKDGNLTSDAKVTADSVELISDEMLEAYQPTGTKLAAPVMAAGGKKRYGKSSAERVYGPKKDSAPAEPPRVITTPPKDPLKERLYILIEDPENTEILSGIRRLADIHLGMQDVVLVMKDGETKRPLKMPFKVEINDELLKELKELIGEEKVKVK